VPTVEQLTIAYNSSVAAKAAADAAALEKLATGMNAAGAAVQTTDQKITRALPSFDSVQRRIDGTAKAAAGAEAATRRYENAVASVTAALQRGAISEEQAAEATRRLATVRDQAIARAAALGAAIEAQHTSMASAVARSTAATTQQTQAFRALSVQMPDVVQGLLTGQSAFQILIQQGGQVAQQMAVTGGGFGVLGTAARAVVSPLGLATAAAVAFGAGIGAAAAAAGALQDQARAIATSIAAVGRSAEVSASGLTRYARGLEQAGVGRDAATGIVSSLSRNPALSQSTIGTVARLAPDAAVALGVDTPAAASQLGDALGGSYTAITRLDDALSLLTAEQRVSIRTFLEHGDRIAAVGTVTAALDERLSGLRRGSMSETARAVEDLGNAWRQFRDSVASSDLGQGLLSGFTTALKNAATGIREATTADAAGAAIGSAPLLRDILRLVPGLNTPGTAAAATAAPVGPSYRQAETGSLAGLEAENRERERQGKLLSDATQAYENERRVLAAGVTQRAAVRAAIEAEQKIRDLGLTGLEAERLKRSAIAAAQAGAVDGAGQEAAAIARSTAAHLALVDALAGGRAALLQQNALAEAAEKAATTAGIAENAYAQAVLRRNAAQEAGKAADTILNLRDQVVQTRALAQAADPVAARFADLANQVDAATVNLRAARDAITDPAIRDALDRTINGIRTEIESLDQARRDAAAGGAVRSAEAELSFLAKQRELIGLSGAEAAKRLATEQELSKLYQSGVDINHLSDLQRRQVELAGTVATVRLELDQQRQSFDALAEIGVRAADRIGDALTTAFLQGAGGAVNFGTVMRGVLASVAADLVKFAVVAPVTNAIGLGRYQPNLFDAIGAGGGSGSGLLGSAGNLGTVFNLSESLGLTNIGQSLGLNGGLSGILSTPLLGQAALTNATNSALAGMGGLYGPATPASLGAAGVTFGQFLGGAGLGFGAGTLFNSLIGGKSTGGTVGSGVGSLAGAAIGSIFGPVGTLLGGLAGGLLGGGTGGLIGPNAPSSFSTTGIRLTPDGRLTVGDSFNQIAPSSRESALQGADTVNRLLDAIGARLTSIGGLAQIGQNTPGGYIDPNKYGDLNAAFGQFRFTANDNALNERIGGRAFSTFEEFQANVTAFQQAMAQAGTFLDDTAASLVKAVYPAGTFIDQLTAIGKQYDDAIAAGRALAASGNVSTATLARLTEAESQLTAARDQSIARARAELDQQTFRGNVGLNVRYLQALSAVTGSQADSLNAALYGFDTNAAFQRQDLAKSLTDLYGPAFQSTQAFADQMTLLERTLQQERLAIQKQYGDKSVDLERDRATALQNATSVIASISQYAAGLGTSGASPLSPLDQYNLASRQFDAVSGAAAAGDFNSLRQLTGYADRFLSASRTVNGSGVGYVSDFTRVTSSLNSVASLGPETVTVSALANIAAGQTGALVAELQALRAEVAGLKLALSQVTSRPSNVAA